MSSAPTVHVLVVHYNTPALLTDCIASVLVHPDAVVHVIDNASGAEGWAQVEARWAGDPRVHLRRSAVNLGFGGGVNALVRDLPAGDDGGFLWVLNPDTVVQPGALHALRQTLTAGACDIVSPVLTTGPVDRRSIWFAGGAVGRSGRVSHVDQGAPAGAPRPALAPSGFLTGAAPMLAAATWRRVGEFREDLFLYWEDVEWSLRAQRRGLRLGVVGTAEVWHAVGRSTSPSGKSPAYFYYNTRNAVLVCGGAGAGSRAAFAVRSAPASLRLLARALKQPGRRARGAVMVLAGLRDGLRGRTGPL